MRTKGFIGGIRDATTLLALGALVVAMRFVGLPALLVTVLAFAAIGALLDERATAHEGAICASLRPVVTTEPSMLRRGSAGASVPGSNQWHGGFLAREAAAVAAPQTVRTTNGAAATHD